MFFYIYIIRDKSLRRRYLMENHKKYNQVQILFFSGTGGTKKIAFNLKKMIEKNEIICNIDEIFKPFKKIDGGYDLLILLFPVYAFNAPYIVLNFIKKLSCVKNSDASVVSISAGGEVFPNFACRREAIKLLEEKGHYVFYENMITMPSNFFEKTSDDEIKDIVEGFSGRIEKIFSEIISHNVKKSKVAFRDVIIAKLLKCQVFGGKILGRHIKVSDKCIMCKKCEKNCPTGNIEIINKEFKFKYNCVLCMKCFYGCPVNAIKPFLSEKIMIDGGYDMNKFFKQV